MSGYSPYRCGKCLLRRTGWMSPLGLVPMGFLPNARPLSLAWAIWKSKRARRAHRGDVFTLATGEPKPQAVCQPRWRWLQALLALGSAEGPYPLPCGRIGDLSVIVSNARPKLNSCESSD